MMGFTVVQGYMLHFYTILHILYIYIISISISIETSVCVWVSGYVWVCVCIWFVVIHGDTVSVFTMNFCLCEFVCVCDMWKARIKTNVYLLMIRPFLTGIGICQSQQRRRTNCSKLSKPIDMGGNQQRMHGQKRWIVNLGWHRLPLIKQRIHRRKFGSSTSDNMER